LDLPRHAKLVKRHGAERVTQALEEQQAPAVMGVYGPDPAADALRRVYNAQGLTYPGDPST
jgi:hypothetical protein